MSQPPARSRTVVKRLSLGLAGFIALGAITAAMPFTGLGRALAGATGYAIFGYDTTTCGLGSHAQTINGDLIRVCQTSGRARSAYTAHQGTNGTIPAPRLWVGLPDSTELYRCCTTFGVEHPWTGEMFDAPAAGDPATGTIHYAAGASPKVTVAQTTTIHGATSGFEIDYAITNTSGANLRIRPTVVLADNLGVANWHQYLIPPPVSIAMTEANLGDHYIVTASDGAGALAPRFEGEDYNTLRSDLDAFNDLDNDLNSLVNFNRYLGIQWKDHTDAGTALTPGQTVHYTVTIDMAEPRGLELRLHAPVPALTQGNPLPIDAHAYDERGVAGKTLRWTVTHNYGGPVVASGTTTIAADGSAPFTIPGTVHATPLTVHAYVDQDDSGTLGTGEVGASGYLNLTSPMAGPGPLPPPPPPPPLPTPPAKLTAFHISLKALGTQALKTVTKSGVKLAVTLDRAGKTTFTVTISATDARKLHLTTSKSTKPFVLGTASKTFTAAGKSTAALKIAKSKLGHLRHHTVHATVQVIVTGAAGATTTKSYKLTIKG